MSAVALKPTQKHLVVILDEYAASFCHYPTLKADPAQSKLMPLGTLRKVVDYAAKRGHSLQVLLGDAVLPPQYEAELSRIDHVKIVPASHPKTYADSIVVVSPGEHGNHEIPEDLRADTFILRASKTAVSRLAEIAVPLLDKVKRLNIVLLELESYTKEDIVQYRKQLELINKELAALHKKQRPVEVNALTDRLMLRQMSNCDAGLAHCTVAPDGRLFVCPAFYYSGDKSIGDINGKQDFPNSHLLELNYSPLCSKCDAFHCKRCVFLSKKLTLEVNIPSWQQCQTAHAERGASRVLLSMIDWPIPEIEYDDPFVLADRKRSAS